MKNMNNETLRNCWDEAKKRICERTPLSMENAEQHLGFYVEMLNEILLELEGADNPCVALWKMQNDGETTHVKFEYAPSFLKTFNMWKFEMHKGVFCCTAYGLLEDWGSLFVSERDKWIMALERIVRAYTDKAGYEQFRLHWVVEDELIFCNADTESDVFLYKDYSANSSYASCVAEHPQLSIRKPRREYGLNMVEMERGNR